LNVVVLSPKPTPDDQIRESLMVNFARLSERVGNQGATAPLNFERQPFPPSGIYDTLEGVERRRRSWQVMPAEKKPHRASSAALAHLDELLDEALEQTFPASDAVAVDIEHEPHERGARVLDSRTPLAGNQKVGQKSAQKH
jgi:hypothetical protein